MEKTEFSCPIDPDNRAELNAGMLTVLDMLRAKIEQHGGFSSLAVQFVTHENAAGEAQCGARYLVGSSELDLIDEAYVGMMTDLEHTYGVTRQQLAKERERGHSEG